MVEFGDAGEINVYKKNIQMKPLDGLVFSTLLLLGAKILVGSFGEDVNRA